MQWALAHFHLKKKKLSYGVSVQTLEWVTPAGCGAFILGGIQTQLDSVLSNPL